MSDASRQRFARLVTEPEPDLAELNLLIAMEAYPKLDLERWLGRVDAFAAAARHAGGGIAGIIHVLREAEIRGDTSTYDDPRNSFLHEVLDRRVGLPIALSVLTVAIANRMGVPVAPVGLPGHFVVADLSDGTPRFLDPFHDWDLLTPKRCAEIVRTLEGTELVAAHLAPTPAPAVVRRMLANLTASYLRRDDPRAAAWTVELGLLVDPDDVALLAQRDAIQRVIDGGD